jgi:hypothetical protein
MIKTGQIVLTRNNTYYFIHNNRLLQEGGWISLDDYKDDLTHHKHTELDIIEIHECLYPTSVLNLLSHINLKCIWRREDTEIKVETPTYIRITQAPLPTYWYSSKIGKVYKVKSSDSDTYFISKGRGINKADCEAIEIGVGNKIKVRKSFEPYKHYEVMEFTVTEVKESDEGISYLCGEQGVQFHESLVKPV